MKKTVLFLFVISVVFLAAGCGKKSLLKQPGATKTEIRPMGAIKEIAVHDKVNVILSYGPEQVVRVEAGENLLKDVETSYADSVLTLHDNTKFQWLHNLDEKINVYIQSPTLSSVVYLGAGSITSLNTLQAKEFSVDSYDGVGSIKLDINCERAVFAVRKFNADFTITGSSQYCRIYCADQGSMDLRNFLTQDANVDHRSIRDVYVSVSRALEARIQYTGNLYYRGNPSMPNLKITNKGKLIQIP